MKGNPSRNTILQRSARILLKVVLFVVLFVLIIFLTVQIPIVQDFARKKVVAYLQHKLKTKIEVGHLYIGFPKRVTLKNVFVEDLQKDTLLSGGDIKIDISLLKLFRNELEIQNVFLENMTAKIKRILPDTVYNYQFIVDAFVGKTDSTKAKDTTAMKMAINNVLFNNLHLIYKDVITGNDMDVQVRHFDSKIARFDPYHLQFDFPSTNMRGVTAKIYQSKPLVTPDPLSKDMAEATIPIPVQFNFKEIFLDSVNLDYRNDVSAFYTTLNLKKLLVRSNNFDLQNRIIDLENLHIDSSIADIRLGKKALAREVKKQVKQELKSQAQNDWRIVIGSLQLNDDNLKFDDENLPHQNFGMDYAHLKADHLTLQANHFLLGNDSIVAEITKANFREQSGFVLNKLQTRFLYASNQTYLYDLYLQTPGTELKRSLEIRYPSIEALAKNIGLMQMDAEFINSKVQVKDILTFAPMLRAQPIFKNVNDTWYINGRVNGSVANMQMVNLQLRGLQDTKIDVSGTIRGMPNPDKLEANLAIHAMTTSRKDVELFIPKKSFPQNITLPDRVAINGTVNGSVANANGKLTVNTSLGSASVNGNIQQPTNADKVKYNAQIETRSLQLGTILQNPEMFGPFTANFRAKGTGFNPKTAIAEIDGVVQSAVFKKYNYHNLKLNGTIANQQAVVKASLKDPNLDFSIDGTGDLSGEYPAVKFTANIDSIKTLPLGLTTQPLIYRGKIDADFPSTDPDNLDGQMLMTKSVLITSEQRMLLDTLQLVAGKNDSGHYVHLSSDIATAQLQGQYRLTQIGTIFQQSIQPYFNVMPPASIVHTDPYDFTFTAYVSDKPLLKTIFPELKQMDTINIKSRFSSNNGWNAIVNAPHVQYGPNHLYDLQLNAGTNPDSSKGALQVKATLSQFTNGSSMQILNPSLNATVANNKIDFIYNTQDKKSKDKYHVQGIFSQPTFGNYTLSLNPDSLLLNYDRWSVNTDNRINITPTNITASNFVLSRGNQQLSINSTSNAANAPLDINFTDFRISTITAFFKADSIFADGSLNGKATLLEYKTQPVFTSDLTINDFSMNMDTVGNIKLQVNNTTTNTYAVNANITGRGNDVQLTGNYYPEPVNGNSFNLELDIRKLQLSTVQGASMGNIRGANGTADGKLSVAGTFQDPALVGNLHFDKAGFNIAMLNSYFTLDNQNLELQENAIHFNEFTIKDSTGNKAVLDGFAYTGNFKNYLFNLYLTTDNFRGLNTTKKENKLYYGQLYFTSELNIKGSDIEPIVDGSITVNDKTNMTIIIPQSEPGVVEREGIVQFVDMDAMGNDSLFLTAIDSLKTSSLRGLDITANIEIKKEAAFSIVLDQANGDFINVKGEGLLSTGIDPSGKITLTGSYELDQGSYEITFNFLRRRFEIEKGSRIVWTGEPTAAQMDVTAVYISNTAPIDLVADQIASSTPAIRNTYLQKLPFEVHLYLTGELLKPVVTFDILLPENKSYGVSNNIITDVQTRLIELRQDQGEINKQVFSLLLLGRFVGENPFQTNGGFDVTTYARESVSRLLTEQLNQLAAGLIDGVNLNFDITSTDDYTTGAKRSRTDLNIGLSKRLLNNRLNVTVGSNFELQGPQNTNQQSNNIAGNIQVDYQVSRDGRYLLRFFRKNEYEGIVDGYIIETGVGFIITVDYNRFREILHSRKQKIEGRDKIKNPPKQ